MFSRRTSARTRKSRERMLALKVSSPRIMMFDCLKFCSRFFKLGLATIAMVGVGFGMAHGWQKLFVENDEFALKNVKLKTVGGEETRFLTHDRLISETGLNLSSTIFSVDTDELEKALLTLPEITSAKVSRRLPGDLKVEVTERKPVAWLACRSLGIKEQDREFGLLVDENYVPFQCKPDRLWDFAKSLPVIMVQTAGQKEIVAGEPLSHKGLRYALDLVKLSFEKFEGNLRPSWVVVKDDIMLEMKTRDGALATLSYYEQEGQLDRLFKVTSHAHEQGKSIATVNLIPQRFVPIVYR